MNCKATSCDAFYQNPKANESISKSRGCNQHKAVVRMWWSKHTTANLGWICGMGLEELTFHKHNQFITYLQATLIKNT